MRGGFIYCAAAVAGLVACADTSSREGGPPPQTLFRRLDTAATGIAFRNDLHPTEELNIVTYLYYYNGGGVAVGDVNGDGLPDLYFGANQSPDALYINEGGLRFRENTQAAGLSAASDWTSGVSMPDVDGDGDLDLYVCKVSGVAGLEGRNELYLNDGRGHFTEAAADFGLDFSGLSTQAAFFDADADGDLDVYLLNHSTHATGRGRDSSARYIRDRENGDRLLLQNDAGVFEDATDGSGLYSSSLGYGLGIAVADLVGDALPDLYIGNDFDERDYLYENLGGGRFRERRLLTHTSQFSMGNVVADLDADGALDLLTLDMRPYSDSVRKSSSGSSDLGGVRSRMRRGFGLQFPRNAAWLRRGGQYVDMAPLLGLHSTDWSWSAAVLDADLDGRPDVVVGNGIVQRPNDLDYLKYSSGVAIQRQATNLQLAGLMPAGQMSNRAFRGRGSSGSDRRSPILNPFREVSTEWGLDTEGSTTGLVAADLDGDGDEDLVTNDVNGLGAVFENTSYSTEDPAPSMRIRLVQGRGAPAVGAKVTFRGDGHARWARTFAIQTVCGFQSSVTAPVIFAPEPSATGAYVEIETIDGRSDVYPVTWLGGAVYTVNVDTVGLVETRRPPPPPRIAFSEPPVASAYAYNPFDAAPLQPVLRYERGSTPRSQVLPKGLQDIAHLVDTSFVTDVRAIAEDTLLVTALWAPVRLLAREAGHYVLLRELTPPGLWFGALPVRGRSGQFVLANIGSNTLLTEDASQAIELYVADYDHNGTPEPIAVRVDSSGARATLLGLDPIAGQMPMMRKFFRRYLPFSASSFERLFPDIDAVGGQRFRVDELRSYVYDASGVHRGAVGPLGRKYQIGTPIAANYRSGRFALTFSTPPLRTELMSRTEATVTGTRLTQ